MRTLALQFVFCLLSSYVLSALPVVKNPILGDTTKKTITIKIDTGDDEVDQVLDNLRVGMLDFGISTYVDSEGSLDMPNELDYMDQVLWRSMNVGLHLVNFKFGFGENLAPQKVSLSTGLKINWTHYSLQKDYDLRRNEPNYLAAIDYNVPQLKKNRLRGTYLQIPFLLEFNSNLKDHHRSLNFGLGYVHQFLLGSNYKYKASEDGTKAKTRGDFNLTKSMGMVEGRFGIGHLNFFVQYGLKTLFQKDNGPELTPINFGVNIIPR